MNVNAIIAVLELKGIITREEGERIVEHLMNKPQSTLLADSVQQMKEIVDEGPAKLLEKVKPVIKQTATKTAKKVAEEAAKIDEEVKAKVDEAKEIAEKAAEDAATAVELAAGEAKDEVSKVTDTGEKK